MIVSAASARPSVAAAVGGSRPMTRETTMRATSSKPMPRSNGQTSSWSSPVACKGILDSYRSAQQQQQQAPTSSSPPNDGIDGGEGEEEGGGEACPVECVTQIFGRRELREALEAAEARAASSGAASSSSSSSSFFSSSSSPPPSTSSSSLAPGIVVVDFYKRACGACKYIAPGFIKLCKSASSGAESEGESSLPDIVFLKHDVERDGDDSDGDGGGGRTALAVSLKIRSVPLFHVYRGRELVASFATRDRKRVAEAINAAVGREVL